MLPRSPLPAVSSLPTPEAFPAQRLTWRIAALLGTLLAVVIVALILVVWGLKSWGVRSTDRAALIQSWHAGREALSRGKFQLATMELAQAENLQERFPTELPVTERRRLRQLHREANLLGDLLSESLEEIARHAARLRGMDEREWQGVFEKRYRGRSVVFDAEVRRSVRDGYHLDWALDINGDPGRIDVSALRLLRHLPLDEPRRLFFGARLAGVRLDRAGTWIIELEPDSGVLLTDPGAVKACLLGRPVDPDLERLLQRQRQWAREMP